jgi:hypothetical protein
LLSGFDIGADKARRNCPANYFATAALAPVDMVAMKRLNYAAAAFSSVRRANRGFGEGHFHMRLLTCLKATTDKLHGMALAGIIGSRCGAGRVKQASPAGGNGPEGGQETAAVA